MIGSLPDFIIERCLMKLKTFEIALIAAILTAIFCGFAAEARGEAEELSDKLIRLHVVANSDTGADQALKLEVRDAVLAVVREKCRGAEGVEEARSRLEESLEEIVEAGVEAVERGGRNYTVTASLCRESFPTTQYDTFSLPAGEYESLRIRIGAAEGHNWWCVVFPPVCDEPVIDEDAAAALGLTGEEVRLITKSSGGYVVRFKTIELINKFLALFK